MTTQAGLHWTPLPPRGARVLPPMLGVVLRTQTLGEPALFRAPQVLCDVRLVRGGVLLGVPVLQRGASVTNASIWVPQAATTNLLTGEPLSLGGDAPTDIEDLDGEFVLVEFVDGSEGRPIIVGALPHPRTTRAPSANARALAHQGTTVSVDEVGNVRVDTTGAGVANDGVTDVSDGASVGNVAVDVRAGAGVTIAIAGEPRLRLTADGECLLLDGDRGMARDADAVAITAATSPAFAAWIVAMGGALGATNARIDALLAWAGAPPPPGAGRPALAGVAAAPIAAAPPQDPVGDAPPAGLQIVGTIATASTRVRGT